MIAVAAGIGVGAFGLVHPGLPWGEPSRPSESEWVGVVHVHSNLSDGTGSVAEIADVANREGLDFVVLTDHDRLAIPRSEYRRETLLVAGEEANTTEWEHVLVIGGADRGGSDGTDPPLLPIPRLPDRSLRIVAHPFGPGRRWKTDYPPSIDAVEVWNADTELRSGDGVVDWVTALALLPTRPLAGLYRLLDHPTAGLALLDSLQNPSLAGHFGRPGAAPVALACAVDAHQRIPLGDLDLRFPRYRHSFLFSRMHLLLPDPPAGDARLDARAVRESIRSGRGYCAFDGLADARGFILEIRTESDAAGPGGRIDWHGAAVARIKVPPAGDGARVRIVRDGALLDELTKPPGQEEMLVELPGPGVYRVEVALDLPRDGRRWLPWILTNSIRVEGAATAG